MEWMHNCGGWLMMALWLGLIALVIIAVVKWISNSQHPDPVSPMNILRQRYASGEISKEEFNVRKRILNL